MARIVNEAVPQTEQLEILKAMVEQAKKGDTRAATLVLNYTYGRPLPLRGDSAVNDVNELRALLALDGAKSQLRFRGIALDAEPEIEQTGGAPQNQTTGPTCVEPVARDSTNCVLEPIL